MIWRPLLIDEALRIVAGVVGRPVQVLLADAVFVSALELALDDPRSVHRTPASGGAHPYLESIALNASTLIDALVWGAGVPPVAAHEILRRTLLRSRIAPDATLDVDLIDAYAAGAGDVAEMAAELVSQLRPTPRLEAFVDEPPDWEELLDGTEGIPRCRYLDDRLFDPDDLNDRAVRGAIPTLYLGHPITDIRPLEGHRSVDLETVRYATQRACSVVLNALPAPTKVRLCHPGQHYRPPYAWDVDEVEPLVERGIEIAHALLYVGVNEVPIGMGGALEISRFLAHPGGQVAVAQPSDCPHSPVEPLLLNNPMRVTTAAPNDGGELGVFVADWFSESFEETLAVQRRRHNKRLLSSPERDAAVATLLRSASGRELGRALNASGISPAQLRRLIEHRHGMTDISFGQLTIFFQHLQARPRKARRQRRRDDDELTG